ncbi:cytochrome o ubiquinol oxidase subunit III, partial [Mesorhizobium sp. M7A.F.Ca.CA.001.09.2.1]
MSDHALPGDFSAGTQARDPYRLGQGGRHGVRSATGHGEGGPASKFVTVAYGFWIFLL